MAGKKPDLRENAPTPYAPTSDSGRERVYTIDDDERVMDAVRKMSSTDMKWAATTIASSQQMPNAKPPMRRLLTGEAARTVEQGGYWLHFTLDGEGIPRTPRFIFVNDALTEWYYTEDQQARIFERLPGDGFFIFLY